MNKVLILGSGLVAKPMVEYLLGAKFSVVIASPMKGRADEMIGGNPLGASVDWSMDDLETLDLLVAGSDVVVSLLPFVFHPAIAKVCLKFRKHMVTTSYVKEEMQGFDEAAKNTEVILLNEIGLDPGIDHMSAMKIIDHVHGQGGRIREFYSLCGALPAPEAADNPMRYKFSWSPKGVILACLNSALYLKNGRRILIDSKDLFKDSFSYDLPGIGELEAYPNRDSLTYIDIYGIQEVSTMYRGTLRYKGWCATIDAMKRLNMFDKTLHDFTGMTNSDFMVYTTKTEKKDIKEKITRMLNEEPGAPAIQSLDYLGFFSDEKLNYFETTPFEITSDRMITRMVPGHEERDMIILDHLVLAEWPDGAREVIKSSMIDFGNHSTNTAISRSVSLPASIAVKLILENKIATRGVLRPVIPEIYNPILDELKSLGIEMKEEHNLDESVLPFSSR